MENEVDTSAVKSSDSIHTQLEESINNMEPIEAGTIVDARVVQIADNTVFVDVGCKSEGKIPLAEFGETTPKEGDVFPVLLINQFGRQGPVVSKQRADEKILWDRLVKSADQEIVVKGTISSVVNGGYTVRLAGGFSAFLPMSQADVQRVEDESSLLGLESDFIVERASMNKGRRNIVVSRRKYLEKQIEENRNKFFDTVKIGDAVKGTVKSFTSFGAFVDLGGFDGLLHVNDMSWGHVTRPKDFVKKGQEIEVKVIRMDKEAKRINLSLKHFTEDPWLHFEEKYHVGDIVKGRVTKVPEFGAFIELEKGIEGLAHVSEFSWTRKIDKPSDVVKEGDEVECMILGYDIQGGRVSLGLKQVEPNPWDTINETYPVGKKVTGTVVTVVQTGAFVRLEDGIDAFLAAEDISWTKRIRHVGDALKVGDTLDVVILSSDSVARRIRVGLKQVVENPWNVFARKHRAGSTMEGEISAINDFGIFVKTEEGLEGLVNKSNVSDDSKVPFDEAKKNYKVGDKVNVYVISVDPGRSRVAFSIKDYARAKEREEISHYMSSNNESDDAYTIGDSIKDQKE